MVLTEQNRGFGGEDAELAANDGFLTLRARRRYAKAKAVFEAGVWAAKKPEFLFSIMVGSMAGVRNSYQELRQDNRNMRKELAKMGLDYADCFCGELSPDSHEFRKRDGTIGVTVGRLWRRGYLVLAGRRRRTGPGLYLWCPRRL
jgi:hypothetical protein